MARILERRRSTIVHVGEDGIELVYSEDDAPLLLDEQWLGVLEKSLEYWYRNRQNSKVPKSQTLETIACTEQETQSAVEGVGTEGLPLRRARCSSEDVLALQENTNELRLEMEHAAFMDDPVKRLKIQALLQRVEEAIVTGQISAGESNPVNETCDVAADDGIEEFDRSSTDAMVAAALKMRALLRRVEEAVASGPTLAGGTSPANRTRNAAADDGVEKFDRSSADAMAAGESAAKLPRAASDRVDNAAGDPAALEEGAAGGAHGGGAPHERASLDPAGEAVGVSEMDGVDLGGDPLDVPNADPQEPVGERLGQGRPPLELRGEGEGTAPGEPDPREGVLGRAVGTDLVGASLLDHLCNNLRRASVAVAGGSLAAAGVALDPILHGGRLLAYLWLLILSAEFGSARGAPDTTRDPISFGDGEAPASSPAPLAK